MKVKVIKCTKATYRYDNLVGKIITVQDMFSDTKWCCNEHNTVVFKTDCEIVEDAPTSLPFVSFDLRANMATQILCHCGNVFEYKECVEKADALIAELLRTHKNN